MRTRKWLVTAFACGMLVVACAPAEELADAGTTISVAPLSSTTFVGRIVGTELHAAAVVDSGRIVLYVCDGHNGRRFDGTLDAGGYTAVLDDIGTVNVKATATGTALTGTLDAAGTAYPFQIDRASGRAGLLWSQKETDGVVQSAGWIIDLDGRETGGVVAGVTDGTSKLIIKADTVPRPAQVSIIAILIGARAPLTRVP